MKPKVNLSARFKALTGQPKKVDNSEMPMKSKKAKPKFLGLAGAAKKGFDSGNFY